MEFTHTEAIDKFYCPKCEIWFRIDGKKLNDNGGVVVCRICGNKRNDGLNQIDENYFQCVSCKCVFLNILQTCPNGC